MIEKFNHQIDDIIISINSNHKQFISEALETAENDADLFEPRIEQTSYAKSEMKIFDKYGAEIERLKQFGAPFIEELDINEVELRKTVENIENNFDIEYSKQRKYIKENRERELVDSNDFFRAQEENIENQQKNIRGRFLDAKNELKNFQKNIKRKELNIPIKSDIWYVVLLSFFGIAEIPINFKTFELFKESTLTTYLIAATLVIGIPVFSHFIGMGIKQRKDETRKFNYNIGKFLLSLIVSIGGIGSINRSIVISGKDISFSFKPEFLSFLQENASSIIFFFILSILLLVIGVIASYNHHDQDYKFELAHNKYQKSKIKFQEDIKPLNEKINQLNKEKVEIENNIKLKYQTEIKQSQNFLTNKKKEHAKTRINFDTILHTLKGLEKEISYNYEYCVQTYRNRNKLKRKNGKTPKCFELNIKHLDLYFINLQEKDKNETIS